MLRKSELAIGMAAANCFSSQDIKRVPIAKVLESATSALHLISFFIFLSPVSAQAPVPDLTGYPAGFVTIVVVAYYALNYHNENLAHRRRLAGCGIEHIFRDFAYGPKHRQHDTHFRGISIKRRPERSQRMSWGVKVCGHGLINKHEKSGSAPVPLLNGAEIVTECAKAFRDIPHDCRNYLEDLGHGDWLALTAAFCQVFERLSGGGAVLGKFKGQRMDETGMIATYCELRDLALGRINLVDMPDINNKSSLQRDRLLVSIDTWEDGGKPSTLSCGLLLRALPYCVGYSYGELMLGAHAHLPRASWASAILVNFLEPIEVAVSQDSVVSAFRDALEESRLHGRECGLRAYSQRVVDLFTSILTGCSIASLIALGSTSGSWIAVTAAAVADPKPVAGVTSAAWGYAGGRRSHLEARSKPSVGRAAVCLKRDTQFVSFQSSLAQDLFWQIIVGLVSVLMLRFKFWLRPHLGFGPFFPPMKWIPWSGVVVASLSTMFLIRVTIWASTRGKWVTLHGGAMIMSQIFLIALEIYGLSRGWNEVLTFWAADAGIWILSFLGSAFSMHLNESTEYPAADWIWTAIWLSALVSCAAGAPNTALIS